MAYLCTIFLGHAPPARAGSEVGHRVTGVTVVSTTSIVVIRTDHDTLEATPGHPFAVIGKGWTPAQKLGAGDRIAALRSASPTDDANVATVIGTELRAVAARPAYNLRVANIHTFRVGQDALLVHNGGKDCAAGLPGSEGALEGNAEAPRKPWFGGWFSKRGEKFERNPEAKNRVGTMDYMDPNLDFSRLPDVPGRYPFPRERVGTMSDLGKRLDKAFPPWDKEKYLSGYYMGKDTATGKDIPRKVVFYPDPTMALDRMSENQLRRDYGLASPNGMVIEHAGQRGYAEELEGWHGPAPEHPAVKMVPARESALPPGDTKTPQLYRTDALVARDAVPIDVIPATKFTPGYTTAPLGHIGWLTEVPHPKFPNDPSKNIYVVGQVERLDGLTTGGHSTVDEKSSWRAVFMSRSGAHAAASRRQIFTGLTSYRTATLTETPARMQGRAKAILEEARTRSNRDFVIVSNPDARVENCLNEADGIFEKAGVKTAEDPSLRSWWFYVPNSYFDYLGAGTSERWGKERLLPPPPNAKP